MLTCRHKPKVPYIKIDGSVPTHSRQAQVNKFQLNSDIRVAILGITAAGTGLTLTVSCVSETLTPWHQACIWKDPANCLQIKL